MSSRQSSRWRGALFIAIGATASYAPVASFDVRRHRGCLGRRYDELRDPVAPFDGVRPSGLETVGRPITVRSPPARHLP